MRMPPSSHDWRRRAQSHSARPIPMNSRMAPTPRRRVTLEHRAYPRRQQWRLGGGAGGGRLPRRARHRHWRLHPHSSRVLWRHRPQADLWPHQQNGHRAVEFVARCRRADGAHRRRLRAVLDVLAGYDATDPDSVDVPLLNYIAALTAPARPKMRCVARASACPRAISLTRLILRSNPLSTPRLLRSLRWGRRW